MVEHWIEDPGVTGSIPLDLWGRINEGSIPSASNSITDAG